MSSKFNRILFSVLLSWEIYSLVFLNILLETLPFGAEIIFLSRQRVFVVIIITQLVLKSYRPSDGPINSMLPCSFLHIMKLNEELYKEMYPRGMDDVHCPSPFFISCYLRV